VLLKRSGLKEVLGFEGRGAQVRFAERIGVPRRRLNNVLVVGYPLSRQLAQIIIRRYPHSSTDFLLLGRSGGNLDRNLKQQLLKPSKENWDFSLYLLVAEETRCRTSRPALGERRPSRLVATAAEDRLIFRGAIRTRRLRQPAIAEKRCKLPS
jgi:hypothetical protein